MNRGTREPSDQPLSHRKSRDRALILPLVGLILLTPPIAGIFELDTKLAGIPLPVLYLFTVWALLIAAAAALSRRLHDESAEELGASVPDTDPAGGGEKQDTGD